MIVKYSDEECIDSNVKGQGESTKAMTILPVQGLQGQGLSQDKTRPMTTIYYQVMMKLVQASS